MSIAIKNLSFAYKSAEGFGLSIPELHLSRGKTYLLLGPSGSGKSTFLNLLAGILRAQSGALHIADQDMMTVGASAIDRFRGEHIGFIFQSLNLIPWLTVKDNIALGLTFAPKRRQSLEQDTLQAIENLVQAMNIDAALLTSSAGQLSIGQQQRVAAARALIGAPDIILADEPSSALDDANTTAFFDLLMARLDRSRQMLLVVSHDTRLVDYFDEVLQIGDIIEQGGGHE